MEKIYDVEQEKFIDNTKTVMRKVLFLILLLQILVFSICPTATKQIDVPAVVGGEAGSALGIQVSIGPGEGNIYTSIFPKTGISTQSSEEQAVLSAFFYSNKSLEECNLYFDVLNPINSKFVDGPSAGAAMAVAVSAALQNKEIREDAIITGTINKYGEIGTVGGLSEKVKAASDSGKSYFLTPLPSVRSRIITAALEDIENIKIIDIRTLNEAAEILFQPTGTKINKTINPLEHTEMSDALLGINVQADKELEEFAQIGHSMADEFESTIRAYGLIIGEDSSRYEFVEYFNEEMDIQRQLLDKGYLFTAANNIFLNMIDFEFLTEVGSIDLEAETNEVNSCINSIDLCEKTEDNWQWISSAEMRLNWAKDKIEYLPTLSETRTEGEEYPLLYELLYAKSWCHVSKKLNKQGTGKIINETVLMDYAKDKIELEEEFISKQPEISSEALRHLRTAEDAFNTGQYITAIYDTCFAHAFQTSVSDEFYEKDIENKADEMYYRDDRESLWGKLYLTQAKFIYESGKKKDAYIIFILSENFENATKEIEEKLIEEGGYIEPERETQLEEDEEQLEIDYQILTFILICLLIIESTYLFLLIKPKKQEKKR